MIASAGDQITDVDSGAVEGIAVIGRDNSNGVWEYKINGGSWTAFGALTNTSATLLEADALIRFVPTGDYNGSAGNITFRAWDVTSDADGDTAVDVSTNGTTTAFSTATETATLTVNAINDAPALDYMGTMTLAAVNEDDSNPAGTTVAAMIASAGDQITDIDSGAVEGIAVIGRDNSNGAWEYKINGGSWTAFGALTNTSATLLEADALIRFVPTGNYNGSAGNITFRAWDVTSDADGDTGVDVSVNGTTTAFSTATETATLTVNAINDAPALDYMGTMTLAAVNEDDSNPAGTTVAAMIASAGDQITDVDSGAVEGIAVIGRDNSNGAWEYKINGGSWTAFGALTNTSATLLEADALIRFVPTSDYNGSAGNITFRAWDVTSDADGDTGVDVSVNGTTTAFSTATETATLTVNAINDAPALDYMGTMTLAAVNEDDSNPAGTTVAAMITSAGGDRITDIDSGAVEGIAVIGRNNTNGAWQYKINGGSWTAFGALTNTNATLLEADALIRFVGNANYNGSAGSITFRAWDVATGIDGDTGVDVSTNGTTTAFSTATETATLTVNAINDAPVLDNSGTMTLTTINEDDTNPTGDAVSSIISSAGGDRITDIDSGPVEGIAVMGVDDTNGTWQYKITAGSWTAFGAMSDSSAVLLDANDLVRFLPDADHFGSSGNMTFRAWDVTTGSSGDTAVNVSSNGTTTPYSSSTEVASLSITEIADTRLGTSGVDGSLNGDGGVDTIYGYEASDTINAGAGNDTIIAGHGGDTIDAGAGNDIIYMDDEYLDIANMSGLHIWLNAGDVNDDLSLATDGATISTWKDKKGGDQNATAGTATYDLSYATINGHAAMTFDGTADFAIDLTALASSDYSVVSLDIRTAAIPTENYYYIGTGNGTDNTSFHVGYRNDTTVRASHWGPSSDTDASVAAYTADMPVLNVVTFDTTNGHDIYTHTGGVLTTGTNADTTTLTSANSGTIGKAASPTYNYVGIIPEILVFTSALTNSQRDELERYMSYRYAIDLPSTNLNADTITGGTGADQFVWTNMSYSTSSKKDTVTDFSGNVGGDNDELHFLFDDNLAITGDVGTSATWTNVAGEMIWWDNGLSAGSAITQVAIDWTGDGVGDFQIQLNAMEAGNLQLQDIRFHNVEGTSSSDTLTGTDALDDTIVGERGADTISGNAGDDTIVGGYGGDTLSGGSGNDVIYADNKMFDNTVIDNMQLWLDANDVLGDGTSYSSNTAIPTWHDKSGNDFDANAMYTYDATAPTYTNSTLNGRAAIDFDAVNRFYSLGSNYIFSDINNSSSTGMTVFAIAKSYATTVTSPVYAFGFYAEYGMLLTFDGPANNILALASNGGTAVTTSGGHGLGSSNYGVLTQHIEFTDSANTLVDGSLVDGQQTVFVDGVNINDTVYGGSQITAADIHESPTSDGSAGPFVIGSQAKEGGGTQASRDFDGYIGEFIVFNDALSDKKRAIVEEYLAMKYGEALSGASIGTDVLTGGAGADTFIWTNASYSAASNVDRITDFTANTDLIGLYYDEMLYVDSITSSASFSSSQVGAFLVRDTGTNSYVEIDFGGDNTADVSIQLDVISDADTLDTDDFLFHNVTGTTGNDSLSGGDLGDTIKGGKGDDTLNGNAGDDTIVGGYGGDTLSGGAGDDTLYADNEVFVPTGLSNLQLWLSSSDINGDLSTASGSVTSWANKAGSAVGSAVQVSSSLRPTYNTSGINGHGVLNFDGSDDLFTIDYNALLNGTNMSIFVVLEVDGGAGIFRSPLTSRSPAHGYMFYAASDDTWRGWFGDSVIYNQSGNDAVTLSQPKIISATTSGGNGVFYADANLEDSGLGYVVNSTHNLKIGAGDDDVADYHLDGNIAEVIIYNTTLNANQLDQVHEYLALKYGTALAGTSLGADSLTGGAGADTFVWTDASHSTSSDLDVVQDFVAGTDKISLQFEQMLYVNSIASSASFSASQAGAFLVRDDASHSYVEIDWGGNNTADFQVKLNGITDADTLSSSDFVFHNVTGTSGNDSLAGGALNDTILGDRGNDTLTGGAGADTLTGGHGADIISGGAGNDIIYADNQTFYKNSVSDLQGWFAADDLVGNSEVTTWSDKSGNSNDASQGDGAKKPDIVTSAIGGVSYTAINFDGSSEYLSANSLATVGDAAHTIFLVTNPGTSAVSRQILGFHDASAGNTLLYNMASNGSLDYHQVPNTQGNKNLSDNDYESYGAFAINFLNSSGNIKMYIDGAGSANLDGTVDAITGTSATFTLGMDWDPGPVESDFFIGDMFELLVFDTALSTAQKKIVDEYLSFRYGLDLDGISQGIDTLTGGAGADTFVWTNASHSGVGNGNRDIITDFSGNADDGDIIDILDMIGVGATYTVTGLSSFTSTENELIWSQSGADTLVQLDSNADGNADWEILLQNYTATNLAAADFNLSNDASMIAGEDTGSVTEDGTLTDNGTLTITDADTGHDKFVAATAIAGSYGTLDIDANGVWIYTLTNANETVQSIPLNGTLTDTVAVTAVDGTTHNVVITIDGASDMTTVGHASPSGSEYILTPSVNSQAGATWETIDLSLSFTLNANIFFGASDGGADGLTFALQNEGSSAIGDGAENLGVGGASIITDAFGIAFDTHGGGSDYSEFFKQGTLGDSIFDLSDNHSNLEDNAWHTLSISWDASTTTLSYTLDTILIDSIVYDVVTNDFSGDNTVYYGFTAGTGGLNNEQKVEITSFTYSAPPIVMDLDGDGIEYSEVLVLFDMDGDNVKEATMWAGADDGFLAYDKNNDGKITDTDEISFIGYTPGAKTDLEGLVAFDTDNDGTLDFDDVDWSAFKVWQDVNQDGITNDGELMGLDELGIVSINLHSDEQVRDPAAGVHEYGQGIYTKADGSEALFADVALSYEEVSADMDNEADLLDISGVNETFDLSGLVDVEQDQEEFRDELFANEDENVSQQGVLQDENGFVISMNVMDYFYSEHEMTVINNFQGDI